MSLYVLADWIDVFTGRLDMMYMIAITDAN